MPESKSGIYKITNIINSKFYIGSAVNFNKRWIKHKSELNNNKHHSKHLQNAWNIYGENNFDFEIIEYVENKEELIKHEQLWFDKTQCYYENIGYNMQPKAGGSALGIKRSNEFKEKLRKANIGKKISQEQILKLKEYKGKKHWAYGTKRPLELVKQLSISRQGKGNPMFGKQLSKESKQKMSEAHKGNKNHFYGKQHSDETKYKIREANCKLDIIQVSKIKQMLLDNYQLGCIAQSFNVSISLISQIKTNKRWSDIHPLLSNLEYKKHNIKGSNHYKSKLNEIDVIKIKTMLSENIQQNDIAKLFEVSKYIISDIKREKTWSHIHI